MRYILYALLAVTIISCGENQSTTSQDKNEVENTIDPIEFYGNTQGTTFSIICNDPIDITLEEITTILADFDTALSSYVPESVLSQLNEAGVGGFNYTDEHNYFNRCYQIARHVFDITGGSFDPTVYPLVDGWGFMKNVENVPDSTTVDSLRRLIGFQEGYHFKYLTEVDSVDIVHPLNQIIKNTPGAKLDFNAVAQGLAVDVLAEEIESRGGKNYFVEIGGEIRVSGFNSEGKIWRIGIDKPKENSSAQDRELQDIVNVENKSIATSGSYRKFYEKDGIKYSHTLDPNTGYPVQHSLLSVTVVADNCALADAMATAFMVMGKDKTISFIESHPEEKIDVYLIYANETGENGVYISTGLQGMLVL